MQATERVVRVNAARRAYIESGSGTPFMLLHGIGARAFSWSAQIEAWSPGARVVAWDAPGYGLSDDLATGEPKAVEYADALVGLLDALDIDRPIVVGHSLGALIAGTFAARYPQRVRALVLLSVACGYGRLPDQERARRFHGRAAELVELGPEAFARKRAAALLSSQAPPGALERVVQAMASVRVSGYLAALRMLVDADLWSMTDAIAAPSMVACGTADTVTPPDQNARVAESIGGARFTLVEGAGHALIVERPGELGAALAPFLASVLEAQA
jgi:pimeloyl-ACP methyl ester carboxylesterase